MPKSFDYIADDNTRALVIGSMPGIASLSAAEYYAHKQNFFWKFVFEAFNEPFTSPDYMAKKTLLLAHGVGLWDAAKSCVREGSLDADIKHVVPNDFQTLFKKYPAITCLIFNGQKAYQLFYRFNASLLEGKRILILPSTSPANASIPLAEKKQKWLMALREI